MWGNNYGGFQPGVGYGYPQQYGQMPQNYGQMPQNYGQQPQGYGQITAAPMRDDRIWVEGEEAARSFLVAANSSAVLWDSGNDTIYFKRTDVSGRPLPMMILDFTVRDQNQKPDYVTRQEFLQAINAILAPTKPTAAPTETEVANNA